MVRDPFHIFAICYLIVGMIISFSDSLKIGPQEWREALGQVRRYMTFVTFTQWMVVLLWPVWVVMALVVFVKGKRPPKL